MKLEHSPILNSKWIKDQNVKLGTIKLLKKNIVRILLDINHRDIFLDPPTKVMNIKRNKQKGPS